MEKGLLIEGISSIEMRENFKSINEKINALTEKLGQNKETELITRHETAKLLKVSLSTLLNWRKSGTLTAYRVGNKIRYKKSETLACLQKINSSEE